MGYTQLRTVAAQSEAEGDSFADQLAEVNRSRNETSLLTFASRLTRVDESTQK